MNRRIQHRVLEDTELGSSLDLGPPNLRARTTQRFGKDQDGSDSAAGERTPLACGFRRPAETLVTLTSARAQKYGRRIDDKKIDDRKMGWESRALIFLSPIFLSRETRAFLISASAFRLS